MRYGAGETDVLLEPHFSNEAFGSAFIIAFSAAPTHNQVQQIRVLLENFRKHFEDSMNTLSRDKPTNCEEYSRLLR
jgi:hypothetical protein